MAELLLILAGLASVVLLAIEFLAHVGAGFSCPAWVGWLGALILAVLVVIHLFTAWRTRP